MNPTSLEDYDPAVELLGLKTIKPIPMQVIANPGPKNGDLWFDGSSLLFYLNGVTYIIGGPSSPAGTINWNTAFFTMGA